MAVEHKLIKDDHTEEMFEYRANNDGARTRRAATPHGLTVQYARTE
jgi:hypothetical protein